MLTTIIAVLGALIMSSGSIHYAYATLRGTTRPNRVTWALWTIASLIAFAAEVLQHVGRPALFTLAAGLGPLVVLVCSLRNRAAYWQVSRFDIGCGALSTLALVLWLLTQSGNIAIIFGIAADCFAAMPTVLKAYRHPHTESYQNFLSNVIGAVLTLATITSWHFAAYGFPLYSMVISGVLVALICWPSETRRAHYANNEFRVMQ